LDLDVIEEDLFAVCSVACVDLGDKIAVVHERKSETALKSRLRKLATDYRVPLSTFSVLKTAQIPRGANGKVDYLKLKDSLGV
jgi:hypothetical protein